MAWPFTGKDGTIENVFLPYFHEKGEVAIPTLVNGIVSRQAFLSAYKNLPPIEEMEESAKKEMKKYVIELFPEKTSDEMVDACKIIYTIGTLV